MATSLAHTAVFTPLFGVREIAGPEQFRLDTFVRAVLPEDPEGRRVFTDWRSPLLGAGLRGRDLLPGADAHIARARFTDWPGSRPAPAAAP
ncbi:hypothetical protein [Streptomyces sp. NPDC005866]|uniref:hypothetical protein n=1 Tax=Streptomyces sp. NPDC005866 TaxID=3157075 RepID=UPI0033C9094C